MTFPLSVPNANHWSTAHPRTNFVGKTVNSTSWRVTSGRPMLMRGAPLPMDSYWQRLCKFRVSVLIGRCGDVERYCDGCMFVFCFCVYMHHSVTVQPKAMFFLILFSHTWLSRQRSRTMAMSQEHTTFGLTDQPSSICFHCVWHCQRLIRGELNVNSR